MSNQKRVLLFLVIGAALVGAALHFWRSQNPPTPEAVSAATNENLPAVENAPVQFNATAPTPQPTPTPDGPLPTLGKHLREIGDCIGIHNSLNDDAPLSVRALQESLRDELGDMVANDLDWQNVHFTLPNGEKRRLRIEVEGNGEEGSLRRLRYYGVDSEDLPIPIPLTDEQSKNPTDDDITHIENQGVVNLREEAHRGFYSKGAELYYAERNGALSELEMSYQGKSIKCQNLQSSNGNCKCF